MKLLAIGAVGHFLINLATTTVFTGVSYYNYPGGVALHNIHQLIPLDKGKHRQDTTGLASFHFVYYGKPISCADNKILLSFFRNSASNYQNKANQNKNKAKQTVYL